MFAWMREIFSSIQGEGIYVGCRQIFLRFAGCNLKCAYCDTPGKATPSCRCEVIPGRKDFFLPNPLSSLQVAQVVEKLNPAIHHSFSLTGGEPLLHHEFLRVLIPRLKEYLGKIYLETNGTLPQELNSVIHLIDFIAMDVKLPGVSRLPPLWEKHKEFLTIASQKQTFVKVVVDENTSLQELDRALQLIREGGEFPFVIQPVTLKNGQLGISPERLLLLQERALKFLPGTRVIPQIHRVLGLL